MKITKAVSFWNDLTNLDLERVPKIFQTLWNCIPIHQRSCSWKPILELPKVCLSYTICKSVDYFLSNLDRLSFSLSCLSYHVRGINVTTSNVMLIKSKESKISNNCLDKTDVTWPLTYYLSTSFVLPWFSYWFVFLLWS